MKTAITGTLIAVVIFAVLYGIPREVASLINMHSDLGLLALVLLGGAGIGLVYSAFKSVNDEKEVN